MSDLLTTGNILWAIFLIVLLGGAWYIDYGPWKDRR